jgi:hypothetical protein
MAEFVLTNAHLTVNSVDLSDHVRSVTVNYSAELQDTTAMSDTSRGRLAGLKEWSVDVDFNQDYAASKVDATLFGLVGAAAFTIAVRPVAATITTTNPEYTGSALLESYTPISGSVGDGATASVRLVGTATLTRSTS